MTPRKSDYGNLIARMEELERVGAGIEQILLIRGDSKVYHTIPATSENQSVRSTAMSASLLALADSLVEAIFQQTVQHICFEGEQGYILLFPLYDEMVLQVLASKTVRIGLILLDINRIFMAPASELIYLPTPLESLWTGARLE